MSRYMKYQRTLSKPRRDPEGRDRVIMRLGAMFRPLRIESLVISIPTWTHLVDFASGTRPWNAGLEEEEG